MRLVLIVLAALIALGGGGAGAYFYFMQPAEASITENPEAHEEKAEKADKADRKAPYEFVELDPLILPIVDAQGFSQTVSLVIVLEVPDAKSQKKIEAITPRLKDAFIQDLYGVLNRQAALADGVVQVAALKARLNKIIVKVTGEDAVNDVLLQVVQQRPI